MKEIKLYKVTFNCYTDCTNNIIYKYNDMTREYLNIPLGGLIIQEGEISDYMKFGHGIKTMEFVGTMICREELAKTKEK